MTETDLIMLTIIFVVSLISSIISGIIHLKIEDLSNSSEKNIHNEPVAEANPNSQSTPAVPLQTMTIAHYPVTPRALTTCQPQEVESLYWMDGKWDNDVDVRVELFEYTLCKSSFNQLLLCNHTNLTLLMQLIPCLSKDVIEIILSFSSVLDLCICKYALLDHSNQYIQFYINDPDFKQIKKTIKIAINSSTSFAKQILNTIHEHLVSNVVSSSSPRAQKPVPCSIYFHNNDNAIINGQYFTLSVLHAQILCKFGDDNCIHFIEGIAMHWITVITPLWILHLRNSLGEDLVNSSIARYDRNYVYGMKRNCFYLSMYDPKLKMLQNIRCLSDDSCSIFSISYFKLYDAYMISSLDDDSEYFNEDNDFLMISNQCQLQLYAIENGSIRLYHEFNLKDAFCAINVNRYGCRLLYLMRNPLRYENILGFELNDDGTLFCICFNEMSSRLLAANIRLSMSKAPKLINCTLLDGQLHNGISPLTFNRYSKCLGIESIHTNEGKDWLVFVKLRDFDTMYETEFRLSANTLNVKYGRKRYLLDQKSQNRKQMSFSKFM